MTSHYDAIVVGGGIAGLAHAWTAAQRGLKVLLTERTSRAQGASVRNFGMLWPIGQPPGPSHDIALRSRERWLELKRAGVVDIDPCGSIHVAHRPDELAVLEEFCQAGFHAAHMLRSEEVLQRSTLVNPQGLLGGMWSETEMRVDPRTASARIARWLTETLNVTCSFETLIVSVADHQVVASDGRSWTADRVVICSGNDLQTLFPTALAKSQLRQCKLQMFSCQVAPSAIVEPHIASGLTLRHYNSFGVCPSLKGLRERVATETPELDRYGIHVMASAFPDGKVLLGDSHVYEAEITPFDSAEINELMLRELRKIVTLRDWSVHELWNGIYAKHSQQPVFEDEPAPAVHLFVGLGGGGMTMSFGLAERSWNRWMGERT